MRIIADFKYENQFYLVAPEGVMMNKILEAILDNTGMRKNSFADKRVQKIFSDLFQGALDLKYIYKKYYIKEYDSFREFLYQHQTLENDFIDYVSLSDNDTIWSLRYNMIDGIEEIIGYNDDNLPLFNHFLEGIQI